MEAKGLDFAEVGLGVDGAPDLQLFPCAFGHVHTLKEEKEHKESQVQELEASLAELRSQTGEWGEGDLRAEVGSRP